VIWWWWYWCNVMKWDILLNETPSSKKEESIWLLCTATQYIFLDFPPLFDKDLYRRRSTWTYFLPLLSRHIIGSGTIKKLLLITPISIYMQPGWLYFLSPTLSTFRVTKTFPKVRVKSPSWTLIIVLVVNSCSDSTFSSPSHHSLAVGLKSHLDSINYTHNSYLISSALNLPPGSSNVPSIRITASS